ncbi:hypothetical protein BDV98DRAFT_354549 [Pterulicium gracile]|uniref:Hemerythrin-like domain-containing protein n=1 Tax=Pterulicium gracile TaxID=1884261 RepID=A0A5C3QPR2_9AGAR|nr:hypothetical protein BDV98DRAFT_354549 [Pterula gracilis]
MAAAHNMFIQGINAMVYHAPKVRPEQVQNFMIFCLAVLGNIHHHHDVEEEFYFPELEKKLGKGTLSTNVEEHALFVPKLAEFESFLQDIKSGKDEYDGGLLVERIHAFSDIMFDHLQHEVPTLESGRMREVFTEKELKDIDTAFMERALKNIDFYIALPLGLSCANPATPWFPPFPLPLKWATRFWFSRRYSEAWMFGPVDLAGKPRDWWKEASASRPVEETPPAPATGVW